jgi:hypothetical protein
MVKMKTGILPDVWANIETILENDLDTLAVPGFICTYLTKSLVDRLPIPLVVADHDASNCLWHRVLDVTASVATSSTIESLKCRLRRSTVQRESVKTRENVYERTESLSIYSLCSKDTQMGDASAHMSGY